MFVQLFLLLNLLLMLLSYSPLQLMFQWWQCCPLGGLLFKERWSWKRHQKAMTCPSSFDILKGGTENKIIIYYKEYHLFSVWDVTVFDVCQPKTHANKNVVEDPQFHSYFKTQQCIEIINYIGQWVKDCWNSTLQAKLYGYSYHGDKGRPLFYFPT